MTSEVLTPDGIQFRTTADDPGGGVTAPRFSSSVVINRTAMIDRLDDLANADLARLTAPHPAQSRPRSEEEPREREETRPRGMGHPERETSQERAGRSSALSRRARNIGHRIRRWVQCR